MTWFAQLRHVFAKDLRECRWFLLLYVAVVVVATGNASGWPGFALAGFPLASMLVVVIGILAIATVVQADSPTRHDAFWTTHPVRPSAVVGAKLVSLSMLIGFGAVGQGIAAAANGLGGSDVIAPMAVSVVMFGGMLLGAMLVAGLVPTLGAFAFAMVAIPGVMLLLMTAIGGSNTTSSDRVFSFAIGVPVLLMGVVALTWLYRRRDAGRAVRVLGLVFGGVTVLSAAARTEPSLPSVPVADRAPLTLEPFNGDDWDGQSAIQFVVRYAVTAQDRGLSLSAGRVILRLTDGSEVQARVAGSYPLGRAVPDIDGIQFDRRDELSFVIPLPITSDVSRALAAGVTSMVLEGRVHVIEAEPQIIMPLVAGGEAARTGNRIRIAEGTSDDRRPALTVQRTTVESSASPPTDGWAIATYAFINRREQEGRVLQSQARSGSSGGLVIPGMSLRRDSSTFISGSRRLTQGEDALGDVDWLRDAELVVSAGRVRGSYPVRLEMKLP